jgi:competence protein ComEC
MKLAFWTASLALGIAVGVAAEPGGIAAVVAMVLALALAVALIALRARGLAIGSAALAVGLWLGGHEVRHALAPSPVEEDRPSQVLARVVRGADVSEARPDARLHLFLDVVSVDDRPLCAGLSLLVLQGSPAVAPGDLVRFTARLYQPRGFANFGLPDARLLAAGQGIDLVATVESAAELHASPGAFSFVAWARRLAFRMRHAMARAIDDRLREPLAGFVRTMVVGERSDVPASVEDGFRAAGATHVLSVSGLHLAVVVGLVFQALHRLLARFPALALRVAPKVLASLLSLPACVLYTLLTGEAVATVRSALMAALMLGAAVVGRPLTLAASISAAAFILLVRSPLVLLDVSFQLSFASVMALGLFARWMQRGEPDGAARSRAWRWLLRSLSASTAASLVTLPLVAHHFGEITPAAPIGNLALVPVVELVVLPFGLVGAVLALVHPWLGALPLLVAGQASRLALAMAELFRRAAPVVLVRFPGWAETFLLVAAAACLLQAFARGPRRRYLMMAGVCAVLASGLIVAAEIERHTRTELRVTFVDVGQGDAAIVEGPGGFAALVDGGGRYDGSFDTGARVVEPALRALGITHLDLVVLSHPHPDHLNGLLRILRRFPVDALWTHGDDGNNPVFRELVQIASERGVAMPSPASIVRRGMRVEPLGPMVAGTIGVPSGLSVNDASLVLRFSYEGRSVLFTGDIGQEGEAELLDDHPAPADIRCDVLKVPHHGSRHASSARLLDATRPTLAVASAGRFNRFGLPSPVALARYRERGIEVLRTDRDGAVSIRIGKRGEMEIRCARGCPTK